MKCILEIPVKRWVFDLGRVAQCDENTRERFPLLVGRRNTMLRKLIYLVSFVLVLGLVGNVSADVQFTDATGDHHRWPSFPACSRDGRRQDRSIECLQRY